MTLYSTSFDSTSAPTPSLGEPASTAPHLPKSDNLSPPLSTTSSDENIPTQGRLSRPRLPSRKSSGTMIIPRDSPKVELRPEDEEYDEDDVRNLSPRRTSEVTEKLGEDARQHLIEYVVSQGVPISVSVLTNITDRQNSCKPASWPS